MGDKEDAVNYSREFDVHVRMDSLTSDRYVCMPVSRNGCFSAGGHWFATIDELDNYIRSQDKHLERLRNDKRPSDVALGTVLDLQSKVRKLEDEVKTLRLKAGKGVVLPIRIAGQTFEDWPAMEVYITLLQDDLIRVTRSGERTAWPVYLNGFEFKSWPELDKWIVERCDELVSVYAALDEKRSEVTRLRDGLYRERDVRIAELEKTLVEREAELAGRRNEARQQRLRAESLMALVNKIKNLADLS